MFNYINEFESTISSFFNSKYAVTTDCCTHAIELCLRLQDIKSTKCPTRTYVSVPMTLDKLGINWEWDSTPWEKYYFLKDTNIIDAAVLWERNSYIPGTMMCVSFQFKKHLNLGRGGIILLDDEDSYRRLIQMSYDGRDRNVPWAEQNIKTIGYHYYMTPETAELGIKKFNEVKDLPPKIWTDLDYPDLSTMDYFKHVK